jgi:hypothetical protein
VPTATSALDVVDGEVRELIRRRGLDPLTDPGPVRLLVRDVVADYSERSLTSALPPVGDPEAVVRDVLDRVAGFGPLQRWLDDPEVEEIWVDEPGWLFLARCGRSKQTPMILASGSSRPMTAPSTTATWLPPGNCPGDASRRWPVPGSHSARRDRFEPASATCERVSVAAGGTCQLGRRRELRDSTGSRSHVRRARQGPHQAACGSAA